MIFLIESNYYFFLLPPFISGRFLYIKSNTINITEIIININKTTRIAISIPLILSSL